MPLFRRNKRSYGDIDPDQIFLDAHNSPAFNTQQFEGRIEKPISENSLLWLAACIALIAILFVIRFFNLQIVQGETYAQKAENNRLDHTLIFADRGTVYDRNDTPLIWNEQVDGQDFSKRVYAPIDGVGNLLGYVKYPQKDKAGFFYKEETEPVAGIEKYFDSMLRGTNGVKISETDAVGKTISESTITPPEHGQKVTLSIDAAVNQELYRAIADLSGKVGFKGGAGVIMDVQTGELIAMTTFPEYSPTVMSEGIDRKAIVAYNNDTRNPFLNRTIDGLYTPGSIVKLIVAIGALDQNIIDPNKSILSTGSISLPNPYDPTKKSVFNDWKAHGWVDMRRAIAVSSNVYFYEVGGGFQDQKGLGIANIEKYMRMFGFGSSVPGIFDGGKVGTIPNPEWKARNFNGDPWRIGDTYFTAIGQYGFQVTPLQAVRAIGAIANRGYLLTPTLIKEATSTEAQNAQKSAVQAPQHATQLPIDQKDFTVVHEGMHEDVLEGTGKALNVPYVTVAAKTGTAELGVSKANVNSWVVGFFPYEKPKYAFAVLMERGPRANLVGGVFVMRTLLDWMSVHAPQYFK